MKRFILISVLVLGILFVSLLAASWVLAEVGPFHPGQALFPWQEFAEQQRAGLLGSAAERATYALLLLQRRTGDLLELNGTSLEVEAIQRYQQALVQAAQAYQRATEEDPGKAGLKEAFLAALDEGETVLLGLPRAPQEAPLLYQQVLTQLATLRQMLQGWVAATPEEATALAQAAQAILAESPGASGDSNAAGSSITDPSAVPFLPGSVGAQHTFFLLSGAHANLACQSCHVAGMYAGTPKDCVACHAAAKPLNHYPGACSACHSPVSWQQVDFDHAAAGTADCQGCHLNNRPANHYGGQCSACHDTGAWKPASFNHEVAGATNCQSCHNRPANHYGGQCSACHDTGAWKPASFNHEVAGATDCQSCHNRPANHYGGQCSACHDTGGWAGANFNHEAAGATNCQSCHDRPANHYSGQCSACHDTSGWAGASFNHEAAGATDCQSCHNPPANHFSGQCSACHDTSGWAGASFNHEAAGATDCQSCHNPPANHYSGQCSACHDTSGWAGASFNHEAAAATNCSGCHNPPANHFSGQCSACHDTSGWGGASFDHSFPTNHGDANDDCAQCHPAGGSAWTCYTCHDQAEMEKHHAEKDILNIAANCVDCHPNGNKE